MPGVETDMITDEQGAPHVTENEARGMVTSLYGMTPVRMARLNSYDDINYHVICEGTRDSGYVLKIINARDSQYPNYQDVQEAIMLQLRKNGYVCQALIVNLKGRYHSLETVAKETNGEVKVYGPYVVRMLSYLPGQMIKDVPITRELLQQVGQWVANFQICLKGFNHKGFLGYSSKWLMSRVPSVKNISHAIQDEGDRSLVNDVITAFVDETSEKDHRLPKGVIHGDFNSENIAVSKVDGSTVVSGIIDFGDVQYTNYVYDIGICLMYMILDNKTMDPFLVGRHLLSGYQSKRLLTADEWDILKTVVCARYAQSVAVAADMASKHPDNKDYMMEGDGDKWDKLKWLWNIPRDVLYKEWGRMLETG